MAPDGEARHDTAIVEREQTIAAWCYRQVIDLRQLRPATPSPPLTAGGDLVVRELGPGRYLAVARFGIAVLWPDDPAMRDEVAQVLADVVPAAQRDPAHDEDIAVVVGAELEERVTDARITLCADDLPRVRVVALALAKSVGLDRIEAEIEGALEVMIPHIRDVQERGRSGIRARRLLQLIGTAMNARQQALVDLALLESPEEAWDSPTLERLYEALAEQLDLEKRTRVTVRKVAILADNVTLLREELALRQSLRVEWIIVILILIEILLSLAER